MFLLAAIFADAGATCPSDFASFLSKFEADPSLQMSQTRFPLIYRQIDHDDPQLRMKQRRLKKLEWEKFERFPSPGYQRKLKLTKTLSSAHARQCAVSFNAPDSDMYAVEFKFERHSNRWLLVEVQDNSL